MECTPNAPREMQGLGRAWILGGAAKRVYSIVVWIEACIMTLPKNINDHGLESNSESVSICEPCWSMGKMMPSARLLRHD